MNNKSRAKALKISPPVKNIAGSVRLQGKVDVGLLLGLAVTILVTFMGALTWPNYLELKLHDLRHRM